MQRVLGIDLGTTNSVMAYIKRGEPQIIDNRENKDLTPSVVARGKRSELLVGATAKARAILDPQNSIYSIKRFMGRTYNDPMVQKALQGISYRVSEGIDSEVRVWLGERDYTPTEISSLILRRLKQDAEDRLHEKFTRAVITVPAYFGERQVAATREAGQMAGFQVLRIINEPTAAALAFGINREQTDEAKTILVYDLGGGTFDISILMLMQGAFTIMGIEGDNLLGGDDFDRDIMERLLNAAQTQSGVDLRKDRPALQKIRASSEEVKIALSNQQAADIVVPALGSSLIDLDMELTRSDFEAMIKPRLERTVDLTQKAIKDAGLTAESIDYILLVGGSTAVPLVEQTLGKIFGEGKIRKDVNPMQCVAIGAAVQSGLIADLECPNCQTHNPITCDNCQKCNTQLYGQEKVTCPVCYMLCATTDTVCWKCNSPLSTIATVPTVGMPVTATPMQAQQSTGPRACPKCGKPYAPGTSECTICDAEDGLKCLKCGTINRQGELVCSKCGEPMPGIMDITPKDLGIQLNDGRMAVVIPKGTNYPTPSTIARDFYTAIAGQRRLELTVYEGEMPIAQQNEFCGIVTLALPPNLPRSSPISVGFGLDSDRTITLEVKVRGTKDVKKVRFRHHRLDPDLMRRVEEQRDKVTEFMDKWDEELTDAERVAFHQLLDEIDQAVNEESSTHRQPIEPLLLRSKATVDLVSEIRGHQAYMSSVLVFAGKYIGEALRQQLLSYMRDLQEAREKADWSTAESIYNEAHQLTNNLSDTVQMVVYCRTLASQGSVSPALANRIFDASRVLDEGLDSNNKKQVEQAISQLFELWEAVQKELDNLSKKGPQKGGGVTDESVSARR